MSDETSVPESVLTPSRKISLIGLDRHELSELCVRIDEKAYRGKQLSNWIYGKAAIDLEHMPDLPSSLKGALAATHQVSPLQIAEHKKSTDGVEKLLVHNGDGQVYECVLLPYKDRVSCCLSSQVGCPMACTFCATGLGGFDRNLGVDEIVGQYLLLQSLTKRRISHVVFMGMGEPMLNFDSVVRSLALLHDEVGLSYRHMTVSTVGLVPQIRKLADLNIPIHLALSLHSPLDDVRDKLMPVNHKWPVHQVVGAMKDYAKLTGRKVTFEYLLINGLNDTPEQAELLSRIVRGVPCVVNLIPFNWVDTGEGFSRPTRERVQAFRKILELRGTNVTERVERGHDISAACGQLAGQHVGRFGTKRQLKPLPMVKS